jgi:lipopolysaccharide transport system ATP-binding protein
MNEIAIAVEELGKRYQIGQREPYGALRDVLMDALRRKRRAVPETIWALKDVAFKINQGEVVGLIGRNGAGKSTLLKILSRITKPTEGKADIWGRIGSLLEVGTGFHPELTGRENIYLNGAILGMRKTEIARKFDEIVAFAETEQFLDTPVKHYSSGMRVRLAFAVAAHLEPEILLVDEVLAVGDAAFQKKCLGKMGDVAKTGRTILFVSHNMGAITQLCSRVIYIEHGKVARDGTAAESVRAYLSAAWASATKWQRPSSLPIGSDVQIRSVHLLPQQDTSPEVFEYRSPLRVRVCYRVITPARDLCVLVRISDVSGNILFTTWDTDTTEWRGQVRAAGNYSSTCTIPAELLKPGRYFVSVGAYIPAVKLVEYHENVIAFDLSAVGYTLNTYRTGMIAPMIPWTVSPDEESVNGS